MGLGARDEAAPAERSSGDPNGGKRPMNEHLMDRILDSENLKEAWRRVKTNGGAPGVDDMTLEEFPDFVKAHWPGIRESLKAGTYKPFPVRRKEIPKPDGGVRNLGIPAMRLSIESLSKPHPKF